MRVFDSHVHIGLNKFYKGKEPCSLNFNLENSIDDYNKLLTLSQYDKVCALPIVEYQFSAIESNEYLKKAAEISNKIVPICRVDSDLAQNINNGFYGAKIHMVYEKYTKENLVYIFKTLEYYNKPLIIHAKFKNKVKQIKEILSIAPKLRIVLAHMGRGHIYTSEGVVENAIGLKDYQNVFFETSTIGNADTIKAVNDIVGSNRIMFGSDYPFGRNIFGDKYNYIDELNVVCNALITEKDKENILYNTAENVFIKPLVVHDNVIVKYSKKYEKEINCSLKNISNIDAKFLAYDKKKAIIRECIKKEKHLYVILHKGEFAGFIRESGRSNNSVIIEEIYILPQYRCGGLSHESIKYLKHLYPNNIAKTNANNTIMNRVLERNGYVRDNGKRIYNWKIK